jgi:energy-coupling factor transporter ATP-binding protein EcfA2
MGTAELEAAWSEHRDQIEDEYGEWDKERLAAVVPHLEAMRAFLDGDTGLGEFRTKIDSLTKSLPLWGFRGTSQMFFNQLVKAADAEALEATLREVLPAPQSVEQAREKLETFEAAVEDARDIAEVSGATQPGKGRVDAFVSFFWELQDRDAWPTFFPNSRNVLERFGLLDVAQRQPQLYLDYQARIQELKEVLGTDTWGVEHLLWRLGQGAKEEGAPQAEAAVAAAPSGGLYASYRQQGLNFPDELVTSLVLSLATKRFVILSGISGTGKTQIAIGLAGFLEAQRQEEQPEAAPPQQDPANIYIRLTAPKLRRGQASLVGEARSYVDASLGLPARGESKLYSTRLPGGEVHEIRINNVDFSTRSRQLNRLYFRKEIGRWVQENARPGDFLHLRIKPGGSPDLALDIVKGAPAKTGSEKRHAMIAVRSDWTDPRGLIGYFNPLTTTYERTKLVELLLQAGDDPERPYVVILDEMNLARLEYYFSDFLSAMESGEPITLMPPDAADEAAAQAGAETEVPAELEIPPNVSFLGTVNVDETTHPFSPKVLDRANVIEFDEVDVERALGHAVAPAAEGLRLRDAALDPGWLCTSRTEALAPRTKAHETEQFTEALEDVHGILAWSNRQFGYRVIDEVSAFVGHAIGKAEGEQGEIVRAAFDLQLRQKIVPKLSGGRELEATLARLLHYTLDGDKTRDVEVDAVRAAARSRLEAKAEPDPLYPGSARKLLRMLDRLVAGGFIGALE